MSISRLDLTKPLPAYSKNYNRAFLILSALSLLIPLPFHHRHDYASYANEWQNVLNGNNPWFYPDGNFSGNAYGPLFNLFAPLFQIYSHLPHLIFILVWIFLSRFTLNKIAPGLNEKEKKAHFFLYLLNPFFLATVVSYGHLDIVVSALCVGAFFLAEKNREIKSSLSLSTGILLKFYPILIFPFLGYRKSGARPRLVLTTLLLLLLGMLGAYSIYGESLFAPFIFGKDRPSSFLSLFRFFRSPYSPSGNLDFLSLPLMALSAVGVGLIYLFRPKDALYSIITTLFLVFMFYKVANPQFYTVLFYLVPLWVSRAKPKKNLYWALYTPLLYVSFSKLVYISTHGFKMQWLWVDDVISLPFIFIQLICLSILVVNLWKNSFNSK